MHILRRRRRYFSVAVCCAVAAFCAVTARLFIWPATGMPSHVDAIVVLGGQGARVDLSLRLSGESRARYLVLSRGLPWIPPGLCTGRNAEVTIICFQPQPDSTQGEAEFTERLARLYDWRSLVLVATPDQLWRAELRFKRCFPGQVYGVTTALPPGQWLYAVGYQWTATVKAEIVNRDC